MEPGHGRTPLYAPESHRFDVAIAHRALCEGCDMVMRNDRVCQLFTCEAGPFSLSTLCCVALTIVVKHEQPLDRLKIPVISSSPRC